MNEYFSCESLGGEKQREVATGECAEKRTQCKAPLAVNSVANFNHHKLDIAVPAGALGHGSYYTGGRLDPWLISWFEFA